MTGGAVVSEAWTGSVLSSYGSSLGFIKRQRSIHEPWMSGWAGSSASVLTAFSTLAVNCREPSSGWGDIGLPMRTRTGPGSGSD